MGVTAGIFLASILLKEMRYLVYIRYLWVDCFESFVNLNLVPRVFLVVARELRKTLVKYDEISKILGDLSHAQ
jgi:hypothetical protein